MDPEQYRMFLGVWGGVVSKQNIYIYIYAAMLILMSFVLSDLQGKQQG
jgi:hypothetical protein